MNLSKRIKYYKIFKETVTANRHILLEKYNIHIDDLGRLYTVCSITEDEYNSFGVKEEHQFNFSDPNATKQLKEILDNHTGSITSGDDYLESITNNQIKKIDNYLINLGLSELYGLSEKTRLDRYNMKIVIQYKLLDVKMWANSMIFVAFSLIAGVICASLLLLVNLLF